MSYFAEFDRHPMPSTGGAEIGCRGRFGAAGKADFRPGCENREREV
jgi:hypothetical protein